MLETALTAGFTSVGMDVFLRRPAADAGHRHAHPLDARRPRRGDLGLAQSLRGQRHQVLRPRRLQALRRRRGGDRGAARRRARRCAEPRAHRPRHPHRRRPRPLHGVRQDHLPDAASGSTGSRSSSTAPTAPPTGPRRRCSGSSAPRSIPIGVAPDGININHGCGSTAPRGRRGRGRRAHGADLGIASTATPTASMIIDETRRGRRRRPVHGADRRPLGRRGPARARARSSRR